MNDLTISIGSLGNLEVLATCLRALYQEDDPDLSYQIWIVYNAPRDEDGVAQRIQEAFPQVKLIKARGPLGYCGTHNLVLRECTSRYVLLLDDDTVVPRGTLSSIIRFMDAHRDVGMAGPRTLNRDGTFQPSYALLPSFRTELQNVVIPSAFWPAHLYRETSTTREVEWLNGAFMLVRKEALDQVGPLDDHYYTYVCEPDWAHRLRKAGWRIMYVADAEIVHVGGENSINHKRAVTNVANLVRYHANRYYFFRKHYGPFAMLLLRPIMVSGLLLRLLYYGVIYARHPERRPVAKAHLQAFWQSVKLSFRRKPYEMPLALTRRAPGVGHNLPATAGGRQATP